MNAVSLTGRLTRDPELRDLPGGETACHLRLAVDGMRRGGPDTVGYVDVITFGAGGRAAADSLARGWLVAVTGRLEYREWQQDQGRRSAHAVIGRVEFLAAPRTTAGDQDEDEIPF